jgi:hypothetical protein
MSARDPTVALKIVAAGDDAYPRLHRPGQLRWTETGGLTIDVLHARRPPLFGAPESWLQFLLSANLDHAEQRRQGTRWSITTAAGVQDRVPAVMQIAGEPALAPNDLGPPCGPDGTIVLGHAVGAGAAGILRAVVELGGETPSGGTILAKSTSPDTVDVVLLHREWAILRALHASGTAPGIAELHGEGLVQAVVRPDSGLAAPELADSTYVKSLLLLRRYDGDASQLAQIVWPEHLTDARVFKEKLACFYQTALLGLRRLHLLRFLHLDLSPMNLLVNFEDGAGFLADFGTSVRVDDTFTFAARPCRTHWRHRVFYPPRLFSVPGTREVPGDSSLYPFTPAIDIVALVQNVRAMQLRWCISSIEGRHRDEVFVPKRMGDARSDSGDLLAQALLRRMLDAGRSEREDARECERTLQAFGEAAASEVFTAYEASFADFNDIHQRVVAEATRLARFLTERRSEPPGSAEERLVDAYRTIQTIVAAVEPRHRVRRKSTCSFCALTRGAARPLVGRGNGDWPSAREVAVLKSAGFSYDRGGADGPGAQFLSPELHVMAPVDEDGENVLLISTREHIKDWRGLRPHHRPMLERMRAVALSLEPQAERDVHFKSCGSIPHLHLHVFRRGRAYVQKDNTVSLWTVMRRLNDGIHAAHGITAPAVELPAHLVTERSQNGARRSCAVIHSEDDGKCDVPAFVNKHEPARALLPSGMRVNVLWALPDRGRAQVTFAVSTRHVRRQVDGTPLESLVRAAPVEAIHPYDEVILQGEGDLGIPTFYAASEGLRPAPPERLRPNGDLRIQTPAQACLQSTVLHATPSHAFAFVALLVDLKHVRGLDSCTFSPTAKASAATLGCTYRQRGTLWRRPLRTRFPIRLGDDEADIVWHPGDSTADLTVEVLDHGTNWTRIVVYEITTPIESFLALVPADRYIVQREDGSRDIVVGRLTPRVGFVRTQML